MGDPRKLVVVFQSPLADFMLRLGIELGFHAVLVEPDPSRLPPVPRPHGDIVVSDLAAAGVDGFTDVVVTDHRRPEMPDLLHPILAAGPRWAGVLGRPGYAASLPDELRERVHTPIGLDIGSTTPAEIAVATFAGLIADRNGRPGGFSHGSHDDVRGRPGEADPGHGDGRDEGRHHREEGDRRDSVPD